MITPAQENERMLASVLGVSEAEAGRRLDRTIVVTHGADAPAAAFAAELREQLERTVQVADTGRGDLEVVIGTDPNGANDRSLHVSLSDSRVSIASGPLPAAERNIAAVHGIQRIIAGCYTAAIALDRAVGIGLAPIIDPFVVEFAALGAERGILERPLEISETALAGAGAIGNGFVRAGRHLTVCGALDVVDPKNIGPGNPNRCHYFHEGDGPLPKATTLCERAQSDLPTLRLVPTIGTFSDLVRSRGRVKRVIVATDSPRVRRSIQNDLPLEVIDASTTGIEEIIVHSHRQPTSSACLACIYKHTPDEFAREREIAAGLGIEVEDVKLVRIDARVAKLIVAKHPGLNAVALEGMAFDSLFKQLCAERALLSPSGAQVLAPFALVSNLAGALLAVELARFDAGLASTNYFFVSPWSRPSKRTRVLRPRLEACEFCSNAGAQKAMRMLWSDRLPSEHR